MSRRAIEALYIAVFFAAVSFPFFWAYATVSSCGWKGLFVECRIQDCPK